MTREWGHHHRPQSSVPGALCDAESHGMCLSGLEEKAGGARSESLSALDVPVSWSPQALSGGLRHDCRRDEPSTMTAPPMLCSRQVSWRLLTACSLFQVLLSGLIGVVSWKRPLSLVVSGTLSRVAPEP